MGNMFLNLHSRQIKVSYEFPLLWWMYLMEKAHVKINCVCVLGRTVLVILRKVILLFFQLSGSITKVTLSVNSSTQHFLFFCTMNDIYTGHVDEIMYKTLVTAYRVCILHCWLTRGLSRTIDRFSLHFVDSRSYFINHVLSKIDANKKSMFS